MNANSNKCWLNRHNVRARQDAATVVAAAPAPSAQETDNLPHQEGANKE